MSPASLDVPIRSVVAGAARDSVSEAGEAAVAVIPARGSSKAVPRKNIRLVCGKPLLFWTIQAARGCPDISRVIVSSDDEEILSVAKALGAEALQRPAELASDASRPEIVLRHVLTTLHHQAALPRHVAYLQPTSPLRTAQHLSEAFATMRQRNADGVISVYEVDRKVLKAFRLTGEGYLVGISKSTFSTMNRQQLPPVYMPNGAIYIVRAVDFLQRPQFLTQRAVPFAMSAEDSIDFDELADLPLIEQALAKKLAASRFPG